VRVPASAGTLWITGSDTKRRARARRGAPPGFGAGNLFATLLMTGPFRRTMSSAANCRLSAALALQTRWRNARRKTGRLAEAQMVRTKLLGGPSSRAY